MISIQIMMFVIVSIIPICRSRGVVVVPGPDEAKVDPNPTAVDPAAIGPVAS